jgi:hypothetical protein
MPLTKSDITRLEARLDADVCVLAARWQAERAVDFDEEAVRRVSDLLPRRGSESTTSAGVGADAESLETTPESPTLDDDANRPVALVLVGRGGRPGFADALLRLLAAHGRPIISALPTRVCGAFTLLALGSSRIAMHPLAGLGAYDALPARRPEPTPSVESLSGLDPSIAQSGPDRRRFEMGRVAHMRRLARTVINRLFEGVKSGQGERIADKLGIDRLGFELGLSADELHSVGLPAVMMRGDDREALWELYQEIEQELRLSGPPPKRYVESEEGDEVEFEPARDVPGGLVATRQGRAELTLNTGKPHPETEMLEATWQQTVSWDE